MPPLASRICRARILCERLHVVVVVHGDGGATREDFEVGQGFEASEQRIKVGVRGLVVETGLCFA